MQINIDVTMTDELGERAIVKGRIERHREELAGETEASFIAEWQIDRGDGDPALFTTVIDGFDTTKLNIAAVAAEAMNGIPIDQQALRGDYSEVEPPLFRDRNLFGEAAKRLLHLPKGRNKVE